MLGTLVLPGEGVRTDCDVEWSGATSTGAVYSCDKSLRPGVLSHGSRYLDTANLGHEATR